MAGPRPSTVISELPDAPPIVSETVVASSEPLDLGAAVATSAVDAPFLPSSQDDLDAPLSALLSKSKECTVGFTHGGEDVRPPQEKEVPAENVVIWEWLQLCLLVSLGSCPLLLIRLVSWSLHE